MPELPDVATFKQYFDATSLHRTVERVRVEAADMVVGTSVRRFREQLAGRRFESTGRHGKYLFVGLDDGRHLVLHFGMTGYLKSSKGGEETPEHSRAVLELDDGYHLAYVCQRKLGRLSLVEGPEDILAEENLGPDALDDALDLERFRDRLADRRGAIKSALMNQEVVAGIGNVYSDEILFQAKLHPKTPVPDLDRAAIGRIYRQMRKVLTTAADRNVDVSRLPKSYLLPHRYEGGQCPRCGRTVQKLTVSGRTGWICPSCQPEKS
jgi:formamidopyrimidine-DNA glycosylase